MFKLKLFIASLKLFVSDLIADIYDLYSNKGCFWFLIGTVLLIYAVLSLIAGTDTRTAWLILVGEVLDLLGHIICCRVTRKKWNRKDSYWSKKDDSDTTS